MHTCPECGQACSCSGDVEDHDTGGEFYSECDHFIVCQGYDDEEDDGPWNYVDHVEPSAAQAVAYVAKAVD